MSSCKNYNNKRDTRTQTFSHHIIMAVWPVERWLETEMGNESGKKCTDVFHSVCSFISTHTLVRPQCKWKLRFRAQTHKHMNISTWIQSLTAFPGHTILGHLWVSNGANKGAWRKRIPAIKSRSITWRMHFDHFCHKHPLTPPEIPCFFPHCS